MGFPKNENNIYFAKEEGTQQSDKQAPQPDSWMEDSDSDMNFQNAGMAGEVGNIVETLFSSLDKQEQAKEDRSSL